MSDSTSRHVTRFLYRLHTIPASAWLEATTRRRPALRQGAAPQVAPLIEELADHAARRRLHLALETMPSVVQRVRTRIDEQLAVFDGILPDDALAQMRRAARLAALALAAQPLLRPEDVVRLYRPFLDLIPPPAALLHA